MDVLEILKRDLEGPDPLDEIKAALEKAGCWRDWTFPRQLWCLRRVRDLTQKGLAARSGVSQKRISQIEAGGDAKLSTIRALFAALGADVMIFPDGLGRKREGVRFKKRRTKA